MATSRRATRRHTPAPPRGWGASPSPGEDEAPHLVKVLGVRRPVAVSGDRDRRIAALAALQRGRVSREQLLAAGVPDGAMYRLTRNARLHRLHLGVYAVGHTAPTPLGAETAALLACGDGAVLSHTSAALVWGMLGENHVDTIIHVTVPGRHGPCPEGVCVHRTSTLGTADVRVRHGLPVTSPARTGLDLADLLSQRDLDRAVDEALVQRLTSRSVLERTAAAATGRRGTPLLVRALARHAIPQVTRSEAEKRLLAMIRAAGLPEPEVNARMAGFEVDFLWRRQRLAIEVDGFKYHSSRPAFERDSAKGNKLVAAGLALMRVTWWQMEEEPYALIARVAQTLARADAA
jgi:very-short-patch-repair endonuclease